MRPHYIRGPILGPQIYTLFNPHNNLLCGSLITSLFQIRKLRAPHYRLAASHKGHLAHLELRHLQLREDSGPELLLHLLFPVDVILPWHSSAFGCLPAFCTRKSIGTQTQVGHMTTLIQQSIPETMF